MNTLDMVDVVNLVNVVDMLSMVDLLDIVNGWIGDHNNDDLTIPKSTNVFFCLP